MTVLSGALLLLRSVICRQLGFRVGVLHAPGANLLLFAGAFGGLMMWTFVNLLIWPNLKIVLGQSQGDAETQTSRSR